MIDWPCDTISADWITRPTMGKSALAFWKPAYARSLYDWSPSPPWAMMSATLNCFPAAGVHIGLKLGSLDPKVAADTEDPVPPDVVPPQLVSTSAIAGRIVDRRSRFDMVIAWLPPPPAHG